jgi:hypothetical protein
MKQVVLCKMKEIVLNYVEDLFIPVDRQTFPNAEHELIVISRFFVDIGSNSSVPFWYVKVIIFDGMRYCCRDKSTSCARPAASCASRSQLMKQKHSQKNNGNRWRFSGKSYRSFLRQAPSSSSHPEGSNDRKQCFDQNSAAAPRCGLAHLSFLFLKSFNTLSLVVGSSDRSPKCPRSRIPSSSSPHCSVAFRPPSRMSIASSHRHIASGSD